jgi:hypothetical protein
MNELNPKLTKEFFFEKKIKRNFDGNTLSAARRIIFGKDYMSPNVIFYGSSIFKSNYRYASDLDMMEYIQESNASVIVQRLQEMVKNILNEKDKDDIRIIGDIKCGIDYRFMIDIGKIHNMKIINYNSKKIISLFQKLYASKLLDIKQLEDLKARIYAIDTDTPINISEDELKVIAQSNPKKYNTNITQFLRLQDELRKFQIIRWTPKDILAGSIQFNNKKFLLEDCILDGMTKFDLIYILLGKYMEVSNTMFFTIKKGLRTYKNMDDDPQVFKDGLKDDIIDRFYNYNYNFYKGFKRIYSLCKVDNNMKYMKVIYKLLQSDLGKVAKLISELKSCQSAVEYYKASNKTYNIKIIINIIRSITENLNNIYDFKITNIDIFASIDDLFVDFQDKKIDDIILIDTLQIAIDALMITLNKYTSDFAIKLKLYPLQDFMLP